MITVLEFTSHGSSITSLSESLIRASQKSAMNFSCSSCKTCLSFSQGSLKRSFWEGAEEKLGISSVDAILDSSTGEVWIAYLLTYSISKSVHVRRWPQTTCIVLGPAVGDTGRERLTSPKVLTFRRKELWKGSKDMTETICFKSMAGDSAHRVVDTRKLSRTQSHTTSKVPQRKTELLPGPRRGPGSSTDEP